MLEALQKRAGILKSQSQDDASTIEVAFERLRSLFNDWKYDFLDKWDKSAIEGDDEDKKHQLIPDCFHVFNWATQHLKEQGWNLQHNGRTRYTHLVAAHCINAFHSTIEVNSNWSKYETWYLSKDRLRERHRENYKDSHGSEVGRHPQYHVASKYIEGIRKGHHSITEYLRGIGIGPDLFSEDEIEAAWWVMIVKGIAWDMSTTGDPGYRSGERRWHPTYVPSKFYDIRTPVWIT